MYMYILAEMSHLCGEAKWGSCSGKTQADPQAQGRVRPAGGLYGKISWPHLFY